MLPKLLLCFYFWLDPKVTKGQDSKLFSRKSYGNWPLARSKPAGDF